jgi:hypothetical protein
MPRAGCQGVSQTVVVLAYRGGGSLSGRCTAITRSGQRCQKLADGSQGLCWTHNPSHTEERRRYASKAGRSKPSRDIIAVRAQLQMLADGVLAGSVDRADAGTVGQLLNIVLRSIELDRRLRETEDLEQRLSELEEALEQNNQNSGGGSAWG